MNKKEFIKRFCIPLCYIHKDNQCQHTKENIINCMNIYEDFVKDYMEQDEQKEQ